MSDYQFRRILLINCLLIITFNLLFYGQFFKELLIQHQVDNTSIGLAFYVIQIMTNYWLLGNQKAWLIQPFRGNNILQALGAILAVEVLNIVLISSFTVYSQVFVQTNHLPYFFSIFILKSLPGALLEEWLFRYLPLRFAKQSKQRYQAIFFCIGALILFTLIHIPAYLRQDEHSFPELSGVFIMGLFFLTIYLLTQNLFFTALFHGLINNPLNLVESPYYWRCFYASILVVSSFWALLNWENRCS